MASFRAVTVIGVAALFLSGCFDGSGGSSDRSEADEDTFTSFVTGLFNNTSDTAEPVSVNDRQFTFSDNEGAFDDLIEQQ